MPNSPYAPCIPTRRTKVPSHPDWLHEVKQDGFRLIVLRDGDRVRLFTRNGHDWTSRYPLIAEAARRIRTSQFVLDGEAVLLGVDGISDFDGLYSGKHNDEVQLYAFDILALDGDDLRKLPLHLRKNNLARLLARRADGIHLAPFEQGRDRTRPIQSCLQHDAGGSGLKATGQPLSGGSFARLNQSEESKVALDESRQGRFLLAVRRQR
jgi:bifunctional non-homologous end joining protein LigD